MDATETELAIIGGGPAGMACARAYRAAGGEGLVTLVSAEGRAPYRRPPLSKELLRGEFDPGELPLEPPDWWAEHDVALVAGRARHLRAVHRTIVLDDGREVTYNCCLLATGARPVRLPVPGANDPGVLCLRTLDDARELLARLRPGGPVVVVGSGFVGCELAASLARRGQAVTLVSDEPLPQGARLGPEVGRRLAAWLGEEGVRLVLGTAVDAIGRDGAALVVRAGDTGARGDLVVVAAGATPRAELARDAGLGLDGGRVPTDAQMRTAMPGLLAAGDVAAARHAVAGRVLPVEHWGDALAQGEVAGRVAAEDDEARWDTVPGFWSTIGDRTLKYAAWGDGHDACEVEGHPGGAFVARYTQDGRLVGVLAHERDEDLESGRERIAADARAR